MNICVVGVGYVGLVTGACFAEFGLHVTCVDKDAERISALKAGKIPFYEPGLEELVQKNSREGRLTFTTDLGAGVGGSLVIFLAVGTPPRGDGSADLSAIEEVARGIAGAMDDYKVIVTKSTVPVGTGARIREIISRHQSGPVDFDVVANPEFLREGAAIEDFMRPNRVVIGASSPQAIAILKDLYRPLYLIETPVVVTDLTTAELIKYASNAFLATKITFINEIANLCEKVGADVHVVARAMGLDGRIGPKFLHPGPGFGGSCLPKDLRALTEVARKAGEPLDLIQTVSRLNEQQRVRMLEKVAAAVGEVRGKTLAVLGLSFKPNTDDIREAPALDLIRGLLERGARIRAFDPAAMANAARVLPEAEYCKDAYDAAAGADAVVLVTEWNQFRNLDLARLKAALRQPVFVDLRNVYEPRRMREQGFRYTGVGRG
ncbi:MAG: UDP-glucose/GDP-mannose dehydrogenase family protein [candidate division NC10 bacterium]|nr:UDP-glucose/GDP-mannose dehydrogenase family protein [candidate division NC10 bacterium]